MWEAKIYTEVEQRNNASRRRSSSRYMDSGGMPKLQIIPTIPELYTIYGKDGNNLHIQQLHVILEDLKWQQKSSESKLARKLYNLSSAQADLYQILGLFFVFQGVVLTAVSQTNTLSCGNWYLPFMLSLLVCIAALLAAHQKLLEASELEEQCRVERVYSQGLRISVESVREKGVHVDLQMCIPRMSENAPQIGFISRWVWSYAGAVLALILLFSAITFVSVRRLLCDAS